jgi:hypothetical protein
MVGLGSFPIVVFVVVDAATGPPLRLRACSLSCVCAFSHVFAACACFCSLHRETFGTLSRVFIGDTSDSLLYYRREICASRVL